MLDQLSNLVKQYAGDGDGDTDLQDLTKMVSGGAGGILDKVKGMFN